MLTPKDFDKIEKLLDKKLKFQTNDFDKKLKTQRNDIVDTMFKYFTTKDELKEVEARLKAKIAHLPTKDDYYKSVDKIIKELQTTRTEETVISHRVSKLETIHPQGKHSNFAS